MPKMYYRKNFPSFSALVECLSSFYGPQDIRDELRKLLRAKKVPENAAVTSHITIIFSWEDNAHSRANLRGGNPSQEGSQTPEKANLWPDDPPEEH